MKVRYRIPFDQKLLEFDLSFSVKANVEIPMTLVGCDSGCMYLKVKINV